jgi:hypothetical protein
LRPSVTHAPISPRESLAERISVRRRGEIVTLTPSIAASPAEASAAPAIAEAHPVAKDLTLSRAAIPTVSWLGVSAPEPARPEPESFERRGRMPAASPATLPPLAPRFSSMPADTMARSHGPSSLPTSALMQQAFSQGLPPAEQEPQAPEDTPGAEGAGGSAPPAAGQDSGGYGSIQTSNMSARPLVSRPASGSRTPDAVREVPPSPGVIDAPPSIAHRDAPEMPLPRMPEPPVDDRRLPEEAAFADEMPRRAPERTDAAREAEAVSQMSGTLLREIDLVERVTRSLPRRPQSATGLLARNPFVPVSLGAPKRTRPATEALLASPFMPSLFGGRDVSNVEPALSEAPMRVMPSMGAATATEPARPALMKERPVLPARPVMPGGRDAAADVRVAVSAGRNAMDVRAPEMPLPPRDRTAAAASAGMLVQRSEAGSSPAGSTPPPVTTTQPAPAQDAGHTAEPGSGGANEVNLLAGEVWALLRRRLAYEAERMGR